MQVPSVFDFRYPNNQRTAVAGFRLRSRSHRRVAVVSERDPVSLP